MTTGKVQPGALLRLGLMTLVLLFGLCTVFAAVATAAVAWQEDRQARWPEVTARVVKCAITRASTNSGRQMYIRCRLGYAVGAEQNAATIYSRRFASPEVAQYPANQDAPYVDWVNDHPQGSTMVVRYDPANHNKIVQAEAYMPGGGPQTHSNVQLLEFFGGGFVVLLTIARITRARDLRQNGSYSVPMNS